MATKSLHRGRGSKQNSQALSAPDLFSSDLIRGAALVVLVLLVYWPTWNNRFISDDRMYVGDTEKLATATGLRDIWFTLDTTPQYYPVVHTALWAEYMLWGRDPRFYHAMNILQHAVVVLLLWRLLARLEMPGAWLAAALFAVHPVHVETVAWVSEQKNLLSFGAALGAMLAYLEFVKLRSPDLLGKPPAEVSASRLDYKWYALALVLYVIALLSKTVVVATPAVLLVIFWWKSGRFAKQEFLRLVPFFVVGILLSLVTVYVEKSNVGAIGPEWEHSLTQRFLIAGRSLWFYAGKLVWPHPLQFSYPRWQIDTQDWRAWLFPIAALLLVAVLWRFRGRIGRGPLAAALIFGGVLLPSIGFFDIYYFLYSYVADHFQYHASAALLALFAAMIVIGLRHVAPDAQYAQALLVAGLLLSLGIVAHQETLAYRDDDTLMRANAVNNPDSWSAQFRYAELLVLDGKYEQALLKFQIAEGLFPIHARIHNSIGITLLCLGRDSEAYAEFEEALDGRMFEEDQVVSHIYLGPLDLQAGALDKAIAHFDEVIRLKPNASDAMHNRGIALSKKGDLPAAIKSVQDSLEIKPQDANVQHTLGTLLADAGRMKEARAAMARAVELAPEDGEFHRQLGMILIQVEDSPSAEKELRRAIQLNPNDSLAFNALGILYANRGDLDAAAKAFREALRLDPGSASAAENLRKAVENKNPAPAKEVGT